MAHFTVEEITSKISLMIGTTTGILTLTDWDLYLSIILKVISIISFVIVIVLNIDKLIDKVKKWLKNEKKNKHEK